MRQNNLRDRLLLIFVAICLLGGGLLIDGFLSHFFSSAWHEFILISLLYGIGLMYLAFSDNEFKKLKKIKLLLFQLVFFTVSTGGAFLVFFFNLLPLPTHIQAYGVAMVLLLFASMVLLEYAVNNSNYFK